MFEQEEHVTSINTRLNSVSSFSHVLVLTLSPSFDFLSFLLILRSGSAILSLPFAIWNFFSINLKLFQINLIFNKWIFCDLVMIPIGKKQKQWKDSVICFFDKKKGSCVVIISSTDIMLRFMSKIMTRFF